MSTKTCSKCKVEKSTLEFSKNKRSKDGLKSSCKKCIKIYYENNKEKILVKIKHYQQDNKEKIAVYKKQYREDNKEEISLKKKQYNQDNKEEITIRKKYYYQDNKEEIINKSKQYYLDNKEEMFIYNKQYKQDNKEEIAIYNKQYKQDNKEKINEYQNEYKKERRKIDPCFKLRTNISSIINSALKVSGSSKKGLSCEPFLSFTIEEMKIHLENLFEKWMHWNNHGKYNSETWDDNDSSTWTWNLDHIIPQSDLPYSEMTAENFKKTWVLSNIRPLSAKQNILDGVTRVRHKNKKKDK